MEASTILIGYTAVPLGGKWVSQEIWYDRLSGRLVAMPYSKQVFKRKHDCVKAIMENNLKYNRDIPIFGGPASLRKYLQRFKVHLSKDDVARFYREVALRYESKADKSG